MFKWTRKEVPGAPRVGVGVAAYLNEDPRRLAALRCLVASFQAQTYPDWRMLILHDGPVADAAAGAAYEGLAGDARVCAGRTARRAGKFGHPHRQLALDSLCADCPWVMLTNDDNYYAPVFLEWLLHEAVTSPGCALAYCDMVHSHRHWRTLGTSPRRGHLDLGGLLVRSDLARRVPFDDHGFAGDGVWIERLAALAGAGVRKAPGVLFVHN